MAKLFPLHIRSFYIFHVIACACLKVHRRAKKIKHYMQADESDSETINTTWIDAPGKTWMDRIMKLHISQLDNSQRFCDRNTVYTSMKCFWFADLLSSILREAQYSSESVIYVIIELKIATFQISCNHPTLRLASLLVLNRIYIVI